MEKAPGASAEGFLVLHVVLVALRKRGDNPN